MHLTPIRPSGGKICKLKLLPRLPSFLRSPSFLVPPLPSTRRRICQSHFASSSSRAKIGTAHVHRRLRPPVTDNRKYLVRVRGRGISNLNVASASRSRQCLRDAKEAAAEIKGCSRGIENYSLMANLYLSGCMKLTLALAARSSQPSEGKDKQTLSDHHFIFL